MAFIDERFEIDPKPLGGGEKATVYRARYKQTRQMVALKIAKPGFGDEVRKEGELTRAISEGVPNIRRVVMIDRLPSGEMFTAYEFLPRTLEQELNERRSHDLPFSPEECGQLLLPIARALDRIHDEYNQLHLDLKPSNLLMGDDPAGLNGKKLLLADFGSAQPANTTSINVSLQYMTPEQAGGQPCTAASDIYGLALVAYEMLTLERPIVLEGPAASFQVLNKPPRSLKEVRPNLPSRVNRAIMAGLAKKPQQRPNSATALIVPLLDSAPPKVGRRLPLRLVVPLVLLAMVLLGGVAWGLNALPGMATPTVALGLVEGGGVEAGSPNATSAPPATAPVATSGVESGFLPTATLMPGQPSSTPRPTFTPAPLVVESPVPLEPTSLPVTVVPTTAPPTAANNSVLAPTATPPPTAVPTRVPPTRAPAPSLLAPVEDSTFTDQPADFAWQWAGQLGPDDRFDLQVWPEGQNPTGLTWTRDTRFRACVRPRGAPGVWFWRVRVIRINAENVEQQQLAVSSTVRFNWTGTPICP